MIRAARPRFIFFKAPGPRRPIRCRGLVAVVVVAVAFGSDLVQDRTHIDSEIARFKAHGADPQVVEAEQARLGGVDRAAGTAVFGGAALEGFKLSLELLTFRHLGVGFAAFHG